MLRVLLNQKHNLFSYWTAPFSYGNLCMEFSRQPVKNTVMAKYLKSSPMQLEKRREDQWKAATQSQKSTWMQLNVSKKERFYQPSQALGLEVFALFLLGYCRTLIVLTTQMDLTHTFISATVLNRSHHCDVYWHPLDWDQNNSFES